MTNKQACKQAAIIHARYDTIQDCRYIPAQYLRTYILAAQLRMYVCSVASRNAGSMVVLLGSRCAVQQLREHTLSYKIYSEHSMAAIILLVETSTYTSQRLDDQLDRWSRSKCPNVCPHVAAAKQAMQTKLRCYASQYQYVPYETVRSRRRQIMRFRSKLQARDACTSSIRAGSMQHSMDAWMHGCK